MTVVEMFEPQEPLLMEPYRDYRPVIIEGRKIPRLTGHEVGDDEIELIVDGRFGATFPKGLARDAAWLIAQAFAIGAGYTHLGAEQPSRPFASKVWPVEIT